MNFCPRCGFGLRASDAIAREKMPRLVMMLKQAVDEAVAARGLHTRMSAHLLDNMAVVYKRLAGKMGFTGPGAVQAFLDAVYGLFYKGLRGHPGSDAEVSANPG